MSKRRYSIGNCVSLSNGQLGIIRYIGKIESFNNKLMYGIEFIDGSVGDNDGELNGKRYFYGLNQRCSFISKNIIRRRLSIKSNINLSNNINIFGNNNTIVNIINNNTNKHTKSTKNKNNSTNANNNNNSNNSNNSHKRKLRKPKRASSQNQSCKRIPKLNKHFNYSKKRKSQPILTDINKLKKYDYKMTKNLDLQKISKSNGNKPRKIITKDRARESDTDVHGHINRNNRGINSKHKYKKTRYKRDRQIKKHSNSLDNIPQIKFNNGNKYRNNKSMDDSKSNNNINYRRNALNIDECNALELLLKQQNFEDFNVIKGDIIIGNRYLLKDGRYGVALYCDYIDLKNNGYTSEWIGIALEKGFGKHCGTLYGKTYFKCDPNKGVFVKRSKIKKDKGIVPPKYWKHMLINDNNNHNNKRHEFGLTELLSDSLSNLSNIDNESEISETDSFGNTMDDYKNYNQLISYKNDENKHIKNKKSFDFDIFDEIISASDTDYISDSQKSISTNYIFPSPTPDDSDMYQCYSDFDRGYRTISLKTCNNSINVNYKPVPLLPNLVKKHSLKDLRNEQYKLKQRYNE